SAAIRKVAGYSGSIISSILFINLGFVNWYYVLLTFIGSGLGGYFGVKYGIKKGESWVRRLMLIVIAIVGVRMLFF
ncbi:MAG: sulfite exporter TauE/SafE family protein, partial [Candidatus Marinimicrobia bacterium]|nr:sulfite exporter TauE/SafE family protein [Candidatus Neomarinimicrobiota bacterium]